MWDNDAAAHLYLPLPAFFSTKMGGLCLPILYISLTYNRRSPWRHTWLNVQERERRGLEDQVPTNSSTVQGLFRHRYACPFHFVIHCFWFPFQFKHFTLTHSLTISHILLMCQANFHPSFPSLSLFVIVLSVLFFVSQLFVHSFGTVCLTYWWLTYMEWEYSRPVPSTFSSCLPYFHHCNTMGYSLTFCWARIQIILWNKLQALFD